MAPSFRPCGMAFPDVFHHSIFPSTIDTVNSFFTLEYWGTSKVGHAILGNFNSMAIQQNIQVVHIIPFGKA